MNLLKEKCIKDSDHIYLFFLWFLTRFVTYPIYQSLHNLTTHEKSTIQYFSQYNWQFSSLNLKIKVSSSKCKGFRHFEWVEIPTEQNFMLQEFVSGPIKILIKRGSIKVLKIKFFIPEGSILNAHLSPLTL